MNERELSSHKASSCFLRVIQKLNLTFKIRFLGKKPFTTPICSLYDQNGNLKAEGCGKGSDEQAILSAKFEALEHFTSLVSNVQDADLMLSLREFYSNCVPTITSHIPVEFETLDDQSKNIPLPFIKYKSNNTKKFLYLPASCTHPFYIDNPYPDDNFNYRNLYSLETTNGAASGCTFTEALIHAIAEILERDSYSLFLVRHFLNPNPEPLNEIITSSLPIDIQRLIATIELEIQSKITIFKLPNELDFPVFLAFFKNEMSIFPFKGFGASMDAAYAIERALLEMIQTYNLDSENITAQTAYVMLDRWPILQKCIHLDTSRLSIRDINYESLIPQPLPSNLQKYLNLMLESLNDVKFDLFYNITYQDENLVTLHAIIPQAEDFFVIDKGLLNPLKERAKKLLQEKT
jgi:ribosomal protein S12 methylthiotransferase accessory factor